MPEGANFCLNCGQKIEQLKEKRDDMVNCPKCGASVPKGKFCLECGYKFVTKCSECGVDLIPGAKFCLECGTKVEQ